MKVAILASNYTLFLYLLIEKQWQETYFIFSSHMSEKTVKIFNDNFPEVRYYHSRINNGKSFISRVKNRMQKFRYKLLCWRIKKDSIEAYGQDHIFEANPFVNNNFNILEDGLTNYEATFERRWREEGHVEIIEGQEYIPLGYDNRIKKVFLTGKQPIPELLRNKVELININELWNNKSQTEKEDIMKLYSIDYELLKKFQNKSFLLTQNFARLDGISEQEIIDSYWKIIRKYDKNDIIIKPHPADTIDYKKYFSDIAVLNKEIPIEFLELIDINIRKILTWPCCTAAINLKSVTEIEFYDVDFRNKLPLSWFTFENLRNNE